LCLSLPVDENLIFFDQFGLFLELAALPSTLKGCCISSRIVFTQGFYVGFSQVLLGFVCSEELFLALIAQVPLGLTKPR